MSMDEPIRPSGPSEPPSTDAAEAFAGYLDELERLCNAATPGPWVLDEDGDTPPNAAFIVAARHALPKLIAKVRELQAELDRTDKRLRYETTKDDRELRELERELFGGDHA